MADVEGQVNCMSGAGSAPLKSTPGYGLCTHKLLVRLPPPMGGPQIRSDKKIVEEDEHWEKAAGMARTGDWDERTGVTTCS